MNAVSVIAQLADGSGHCGGMMCGWGNGWMWIWGPMVMIVVVGAIAASVVWVVRSTRQPQSRVSDRAEEILAERFARGEITAEEYRERLDAIR